MGASCWLLLLQQRSSCAEVYVVAAVAWADADHAGCCFTGPYWQAYLKLEMKQRSRGLRCLWKYPSQQERFARPSNAKRFCWRWRRCCKTTPYRPPCHSVTFTGCPCQALPAGLVDTVMYNQVTCRITNEQQRIAPVTMEYSVVTQSLRQQSS